MFINMDSFMLFVFLISVFALNFIFLFQIVKKVNDLNENTFRLYKLVYVGKGYLWKKDNFYMSDDEENVRDSD